MFLVPASAPGLEIIRNVGLGSDPSERGSEGYVRYEQVRVPRDHLLGEVGEGFRVAQTRLGGGRLHHAMRTVGQLRNVFDMMCERAVSRQTRHGTLGSLQMTQERIADSWVEVEQFRLLVLRAAWLIDKYHDYARAQRDIAAVKIAMPKVLHDVTQRALHLHGALGVSNEMPFMAMMTHAEVLAVADGPTELHKMVLAREVLGGYQPVGRWPSAHLPSQRERAHARLAELIDVEVGGP
jgi:acyl-CoA dehydrogenase